MTDDMDMSSSDSSSSNSSSMDMIFTTSHTTPLYTSTLTPRTPAGYAGLCIFLLLLSLLARFLSALTARIETRFHHAALARRYIRVSTPPDTPSETHSTETFTDSPEKATLSIHGLTHSVRLLENTAPPVQPWRLRTDGLRAVLSLVNLGLSYLLMLAVMTMNVGYFFSVLAGHFIGTLLVGRYMIGDNQH